MDMSTEISTLERELEQAKAELHQENQRGALKDSNKVAELEQKMADLTQKLDVEMRLAENKQVHEQRVEESHDQIAYILDTLRAGDLSMRDLTTNEAGYQILREMVQLTMMEREEKYLGEINKLREENAVITASKDALQEQCSALYETVSELRSDLNTTKSELEDAELKRDAAASQLEEAKKEIARLNGHIDDLRAEIAVGAKGAVKVTNLNGNLADLVQQFNASKPAIYNKRWKDEYKKTIYLANLAETGAEIEIPYLEIGKYREVTPDEAELFRAEYEAKCNQESATVDAGQGVDVNTPDQFQEEDSEGPVSSLDEGHTGLEVAGQGSTLEDRVAALERVVFGEVKGAA